MQPRFSGALVLAVGLMGLPRDNCCQLQTMAAPSHYNEAASKSSSCPPAELPTAATWPGFLEATRQTALAYVSTLPDFTCTQHVQRRAKFGAAGNWELVDEVIAEVSYHNKSEIYQVMKIGGKPATSKAGAKAAGVLSVGDFGNALYLLFAPESNAAFRMEHPENVKGRATVIISFQVPRSSSRQEITLGDKTVVTAYSGRCWVELGSHQVVQLESHARDIPGSFPAKRSSRSIEYDLVAIAGNRYWLPVRAQVHLELKNDHGQPQMDFYRAIYGKQDPSGSLGYSVMEAQNIMEFRDYRKFSAEVRFVHE